jgi:hypothetical protein
LSADVREQIEQNLLQPHCVNEELRRRRRLNVECEIESLRIRGRLTQMQCTFNGVKEARGRWLQLQAAGFDLTHSA